MALSSHVPVLCAEVLSLLTPRSAGRYIDCTLGDGGHARAILEASSPDGRLLGFDADPQAVRIAEMNLATWASRIMLFHKDYTHVAEVALERGFAPADGILIDLGWSSTQMGDPGRGFSFSQDGPLDMRYDPSGGPTAADLLNTLPERELADLIWRYGEERYARRIARAIVRARPLSCTMELAGLIAGLVGFREKIHPATRTFQALRIGVNDELGRLESTLEQLPGLLAPGGVMVIISFHSLEDRLVKSFLARESVDCVCPPELPVCRCAHRATVKVLTRKPIRPAEDEQERNPRSRSARLRAARRLGNGPEFV